MTLLSAQESFLPPSYVGVAMYVAWAASLTQRPAVKGLLRQGALTSLVTMLTAEVAALGRRNARFFIT